MEMVDVIRDVSEEAESIALDLVEANNYDLVGICRASEWPSDDYLYYVIGRSKRSGSYTSWLMNTSTEVLNIGKYGFRTHVECLLDVLQQRITYIPYNKKEDY